MQRGALTLVVLLLAISAASCDDDGTASTTVPTPPSVATTATTATAASTTTITTPVEAMPPLRLPAFPGREELAQAWAQWDENGWQNYRFIIKRHPQPSPYGIYEVFVVGDEVSVTEIEPSLEDGPATEWMMFGSVERLFAFIESNPSEYLTVTYDPELGYPTSIIFRMLALEMEWGIRVSELQPYDWPLPSHEIETTPYGWGWRRFRSVRLVVEGVVRPPVRFVDSQVRSAWAVPIEDAVIHHIRHDRWEVTHPLEVLDYAPSGPRTLRGHEGDEIILFLGRFPGQSWYVIHAARRTDDGLEFLGPYAEFTTINDEIPQLCSPNQDRDADAELDLLIRWSEELAALTPDDDRSTALSRACASQLTF